MTIRPIQTSDGWEILEWSANGGTYPLPGGMIVKTATKESANDLCFMVAEQLGSLGFRVELEQVE